MPRRSCPRGWSLDFSLEFIDLLVVFLTLFVLEVVLGVDNVIFISILSGKLPPAQQQRARRGTSVAAMFMRIASSSRSPGSAA